LWGSISAEKVKSFATHTFHTAAPIAFGKSAAKLALFPHPSPEPSSPAKGPEFLRHDLSARLKQGALTWSLKAQLFVDQSTTPIEDAAVKWQGPWIDLATLTLPKQDTDSARGLEIGELVSRMSFDPWHAIEEHRPLGAMMRARGATYGASVQARNAAPEPKSVLAPA
jgi:hypothetical protein